MTKAKKLSDAIIQNDTATASSLISSGSVILNGKPWPLHRAAERGRVEIMTMLLDAGADINAVDERGHTACRIAISDDHFDALKLLVERGANLAVVDSRDRTLLSYVARYCNEERFVILLLDAGAPLDRLSNGELMMLVSTHRCLVGQSRRLTRPALALLNHCWKTRPDEEVSGPVCPLRERRPCRRN
jgi:ankyrin repeat protein